MSEKMQILQQKLKSNPRLKEMSDKMRDAGHAAVNDLATTLTSGVTLKDIADKAGMPDDILKVSEALGLTPAQVVAELITTVRKETLILISKIKQVSNVPDSAYPALVESMCKLMVDQAHRVQKLNEAMLEGSGHTSTPLQ